MSVFFNNAYMIDWLQFCVHVFNNKLEDCDSHGQIFSWEVTIMWPCLLKYIWFWKHILPEKWTFSQVWHKSRSLLHYHLSFFDIIITKSNNSKFKMCILWRLSFFVLINIWMLLVPSMKLEIWKLHIDNVGGVCFDNIWNFHRNIISIHWICFIF